MQATCASSVSWGLFQRGFFKSSFNTPPVCLRADLFAPRVQLRSRQCRFHTASATSSITDISLKQLGRKGTGVTRLSVSHKSRRHETTTATVQEPAGSSSSTPPSSQSTSNTTLAWNDFFRLRQRRRYLNVGCSAVTATASSVIGFSVVAAQDLETLQIASLDPLFTSGIICLVFAAGGWLAGPLLGGAIFRVFIGRGREMSMKERDFYTRIRRYRVDPSSSSMRNPVPDYHGEKITSVQRYRQWLKDQKAFRRKRESLV